ncbi:MAG: hypothetical protein ABWZ80_00160 [Beijerinckiaceae bacterium]
MVRNSGSGLKVRASNGFELEALTPAEGRELALYVAHMTAEMSAMSRAAGYDLLAYFLDMARIEARIQSETGGDTSGSA